MDYATSFYKNSYAVYLTPLLQSQGLVRTFLMRPVTGSELSAMYLTVFVEQLKHCVHHVRVEHLSSRYINSSLEFLWGGK